MEEKPSTMVIIEPRFLVRDGLVSLMESHSYHVVGAIESAADDKTCRIVLAPKIVILGAHSAEGAAAEASAVRRVWPNAKIILLFEQASGEDFNQLLAVAHIDACLPFSVSPPTLLGILELVLKDGHRIYLVDASTSGLTIRSPNKKQNAVDLAERYLETLDHGRASKEEASFSSATPRFAESMSEPSGTNGFGKSISSVDQMRDFSQREEQVLQGLLKGHSNKIIARACTVTEATVKVHMKSILRKIRVANRTQAAIWAMGNGYSTEEVETPMTELSFGVRAVA
jgi:two-component system nitrate/nitrite response regulator NarL